MITFIIVFVFQDSIYDYIGAASWTVAERMEDIVQELEERQRQEVSSKALHL